ncbi:MAG: SpoIIE family protein phosphatase, partial [Spirochaeta sp.]
KIEPGDRLVLFTDGLYDRGAARSISLQVLEQIFLQSDKHADFLAQVRRLLRSQDAMEISGSAKFGDDDLTIISVKLHEHY